MWTVKHIINEMFFKFNMRGLCDYVYYNTSVTEMKY